MSSGPRGATGGIDDTKTEKNQHAVALGKLGRAKGSKARAANLSRNARKSEAKGPLFEATYALKYQREIRGAISTTECRDQGRAERGGRSRHSG